MDVLCFFLEFFRHLGYSFQIFGVHKFRVHFRMFRGFQIFGVHFHINNLRDECASVLRFLLPISLFSFTPFAMQENDKYSAGRLISS